MENQGDQPAEAAASGSAGADGGDAALENLGLGEGLELFAVDSDLAEYFQNCPDWNDPLLDPSVLDELRDCLSDDLWSSPDLQLLTEGDHGPSSAENLQLLPPEPPASAASPPGSPGSALSPTPSVASAVSSTVSYPLSDASTPQKVPSPWNELGFDQTGTIPSQNGTVPTQTSTALQQPMQWNLLPSTTPAAAVQVLKSGEVVQVPTNTQQQQQQIMGIQMSPPPAETPPTQAQTLPTQAQTPPTQVQTPPTAVEPGSSGSSGAAGSPRETEGAAGSRKRQHPDSGDNTLGGADISQLSKKQQRLIKNREAASVSRQKKKQYVQTLEARLREAAVKNSTLLQDNESLRKQVVLLEAENKVLRLGLGQSPLSRLQKPALVMAICLCFVSLLFLPKFTSLSSGTTSTALSVTQSSHVPGRALLQYNTPQSPSLDRSSESHSLSSSDSSRALVQVSASLTDRAQLEKALDQKLQELHSLYAAIPCPQPPVPSVCSCPAQNDTTNSTALRLLSEETTECFKWYEEHYPRWLHSHQGTPDENSLALVVNSNTDSLLRNSGDLYQLTELHDMPLLYKSFKKYFTRKLDTFYLISFKDHLLLNAPLHNTTENPLLSVIIPTQGFSLDTLPMLQMDCEILSTNIIHLPRATG